MFRVVEQGLGFRVPGHVFRVGCSCTLRAAIEMFKTWQFP